MMLFSGKRRNQLSDGALLARYGKSKDLEDLAELFNRYTHLIYGVCLKYLKNKEDSQDAVMQIFEKLINDVSRFEINNFSSWLYVFSKNFCLMKIRSSKVGISIKEVAEMNEIMENNLHQHHDENKFDLESNLQVLEKCIEKLLDAQKECIQLFYLKSFSYKQIVDKTEYPLNKVKSYIQNGKRNLKNCIEHTGASA